MNNNKLNEIYDKLSKINEKFIEELVEINDSDDAVETHEKDWMRKNQWKQPWNKKRTKKR